VPDDHLLAGLLARWTGDGALMRAVLADNPARLYDFGPA
jgi:hypothetical protein